ncbi:lysophospholipid acyltransferase family protein [Hoylesella timonensis]|uniref:lysophospholipid acyltransferase family protein n=1 Tax=Hoylesella timonensis TaxID=386414 RepID=UPI00288A7774|nr:lysophospholipid acyltransferase family protein [Hoylesella timonensis]
MKYLYRIYQLFIAAPLVALLTLLTTLLTTLGCVLGNGHFWGYYPGKCWSWLTIRILLLPVKVEGREHLDKKQSYVFVSNHQGAFDIFLIYGFLGRNFKWMMKYQLRKMPFIGMACQAAHHIFVDKRGTAKIKQTYLEARQTLKDGMSLVVFPEGARTFTGHMGDFKRGAYMLASDLQLPVVPLTINGSFQVMPRMRDMKWVQWHPLTLTIHEPIPPKEQSSENITATLQESYQVIMKALPTELQGYQPNSDQ